MILDAWIRHPTLRHSRDPVSESVRRWTKLEMPTRTPWPSTRPATAVMKYRSAAMARRFRPRARPKVTTSPAATTERGRASSAVTRGGCSGSMPRRRRPRTSGAGERPGPCSVTSPLLCYASVVSRNAKLPPELHSCFWDCRPRELDVERHAGLILTRLLDYGDLAAVQWALRTYGRDEIREFVRGRGARILSRKTLAFWRGVLNLEDEPRSPTS